jgi:hypothetical protein
MFIKAMKTSTTLVMLAFIALGITRACFGQYGMSAADFILAAFSAAMLNYWGKQ